MSKEEIMMKILTASAETLGKVEGLLNGSIDNQQERISTRMLNFRQAADALNVSTQTIRRMIAAGRLPVVEIRAQRFRVPEAAIVALVEKATRKEVA